MPARNLSKLIPRILRSDFWVDFLDAVAAELDAVRENFIVPLLTHFDKWNITDSDRLIEISEMLGHDIDISLDDSVDNIRLDLDSIPLRIRKKATYTSYDHIFNFIPHEGQVFIAYWTTVDLFRAYDIDILESEGLGILDAEDGGTTPFQFDSIDAPSGNAVSESTVQVRNGQRSYLFTFAGSSTDCNGLKSITASDEVYVRFFIYIDQWTAGTSNNILKLHIDSLGAGAEPLRLILYRIDSNYAGYEVEVNNGANSIIDHSTEEKIQFGGWRSIEVHFLRDASAGGAAVYIDGELDDSDFTTDTTVVANVQSARLGFDGGTGNPANGDRFYIDDGKIDTSYIGERLIYTIHTHDVTTPYELQAELNYADFVEGVISLDEGRILDSGLTLDANLDRLATKHLFVEYTVYQILVEDSTDYNMTNVYLQFLDNVVSKNRKCVEVPHIGCQISALCDNSGYYDNAYPSFNAYTIDDIQLKSSIISAAYAIDSIPRRIAIGIGSQAMESAYTGGSNPTVLDDQISIKDLDTLNNVYTISGSPDWEFAYSVFQGNTVRERLLDVGDGIDDTFGGTLEHFPVIPGSLQIQYESSTITYIVSDSQKDGILIGDRATGTIDYETGVWALVTKKDLPITNELVATGSQSAIVAHFMNFQDIVPSTFRLTYVISSTTYIAADDGLGNITGTGITSGTINYSTGQLDVAFSPSTDGGQNITADYEYTATSIPNASSDITALVYEVTKNLDVTEAGLFNEAGNLIAYATFAPIQLRNPLYHASIQFFIKQGSF